MSIVTINEALKQTTPLHGANIYQAVWQLEQAIIPLRNAVFEFIISKLCATDVQALMCIYLETMWKMTK